MGSLVPCLVHPCLRRSHLVTRVNTGLTPKVGGIHSWAHSSLMFRGTARSGPA